MNHLHALDPTYERLVLNRNFHGVFRDFPGEKAPNAVALGRRKSQQLANMLDVIEFMPDAAP